MPELDMTDALTGVDTNDELQVTRFAQTVDSTGTAINTALYGTPVTFYGTVTSDRGKLLERGTDAERIAQVITVVTKFKLNDGKGAGQTADIVTWPVRPTCDARQYTVTHIDDYSRYGQGFIQATCELKSVNG